MQRHRIWLGVVLVLGFVVAIWSMRGFTRRSEGFVSASSCKSMSVNPEGVALADVVVTVAETPVIPANPGYCGGLIINTDSINAVRCNQLGTAPTATTGLKLLPYMSWSLDQEAVKGISCIRDTDATGDVSLSVMVVTP